MYHQDWIMRQIQMIIQFIVKLIWNKDVIEYEILDYDRLLAADVLYKDLLALSDRGEICKAEDLLFERLDAGNREYLKIAVVFYQKISLLSDGELEAANFSREEIADGLGEIMKRFGLPSFAV